VTSVPHDSRPPSGAPPPRDGRSSGASPWAGRSHAELAELARELLLAGHLIDRSGMPHLISRFGPTVMAEVAIGEWVAASPIYTRRMQRLLGFEGENVEAIFKGMQLDVGAPPEFMDFRYTVHDDHHGEFHLDHCGALMDVEPLGDDYVRTMCHDIEDPTFDATAAATNPRARVRPIHRPPRVPADREPHCAWTVTIDPDAEALAYPPAADHLAGSEAAGLGLATPEPTLPVDDGWADYSGPLDQDLVMERFCSATLSAILDEVALQGHLLARAYLIEVAERSSGEEAAAIGVRQAVGIAGVTTKRLAAALGAPPDLDGVARVLAVHPLFLPRSYVALRLEAAEGRLTVTLGRCPATSQDDGLTWPALTAGGGGPSGGDAILAGAVQCLAPTATVERLATPTAADARATWRITADAGGTPVAQPDDVTLTEFSTGATFAFDRRA